MGATLSFLGPGQYLATNDILVTPDGGYFAIMQADGNLCVYAGTGPSNQGAGSYCFRASSEPTGDFYAVMQGDGNLCVYQGTDPAHQGQLLWNSGPHGSGSVPRAFFASLPNGGNLEIAEGNGPSDRGAVVWQAVGPPPGYSVDNLYNLQADSVPGAVQSAFTAQLQASPSVQSTFFSSAAAPAVAPVDADQTDSVAAALASSAISRSSLYGFGGTVNQSTADAWWHSRLAGGYGLQASRSLYDTVFPANCTDPNAPGTTFQDYLDNNPASWAQQLADRVTASSFINVELNKLIAGDPNWLAKVNLIYYKLSRLDPSQEQRVVTAFTSAYSNAVEQWQTYNYLTGMFQPDVWMDAVQAAIQVRTFQFVMVPGAGGMPTRWVYTYYGQAVGDFLGGKPAALSLTTGNLPSNVTFRPAM
ncbi:MAG: hypothetical protein QOI91_273 [Solirubrobacteraceae bacterium]|jgi:hypothetical protein|nr:hypothetical protein [Solirubrobacteraceae bacterium]